MNSIRTLALGALLVVLACSASAQPATPQVPAVQPQSLAYKLAVSYYTRLLRVELKLDREVYFTGEMAELTLTVTNPTSSPLEVEEPFSAESGDIWLRLQKSDHFEAVPQRTRESFSIGGAGVPEPVVHTVLMQPGERRQRTIRTDDAMFDDDEIMDLTIDGFLPITAGHYRFSYGYGSGGSIEFDIVQPVVRRVIQPAAPWTATGGATEFAAKPWGGPLGELEWDGKRYLVASLRPGTVGYQRFPDGPLAPFVRLDTLERQVPAVEYTKAEDGSVTFIWTGADGSSKQLPHRRRRLTKFEMRALEAEKVK